MKNSLIWLLPVLSGLLMGISWPETGGMTPLIFIGLIPMLYMEYLMSRQPKGLMRLKLFLGAYVAFFIFNFFTTWWILYASLPGMIMAEVFNSLFMACIFMFFHLARKNLGDKAGYASLVIFWLAFEWLHYNWELSWVWLTLGNVFANQVKWIQWYEYTGVLGGSFWVLITNIMLFNWFRRTWERTFSSKTSILQAVLITMVVAVPIILSSVRYYAFRESKEPVEIVVVQPNIDPYHEKFYGMAESDQIDLLVELASAKITDSTDFLVFPETAFPMGYWEHELEYIYGVQEFRTLLKQHPRLRIVTGISSMRLYAPGEQLSPTARSYKDGTNNHYDYYNTAMHLDTGQQIQLYHKSKLVLGVEKMPFGSLLKPLEELSIELGGASGSLGYEEEALNFVPILPNASEQLVAPVICYESVYGEYLAEYVQKGASLIFIITNDGWWENTPGYRQHLAYGRLRAIEMRRSIARSANTGISAFIDQRGDVHQPTEWWTRLAIRGTINAAHHMTFYARNGDYLGRVAAFFAVLLLAWTAVRSLNKKNRPVIG